MDGILDISEFKEQGQKTKCKTEACSKYENKLRRQDLWGLAGNYIRN
jgi:hypothetical protein